jgi:hypothetical protein
MIVGGLIGDIVYNKRFNEIDNLDQSARKVYVARKTAKPTPLNARYQKRRIFAPYALININLNINIFETGIPVVSHKAPLLCSNPGNSIALHLIRKPAKQNISNP